MHEVPVQMEKACISGIASTKLRNKEIRAICVGRNIAFT